MDMTIAEKIISLRKSKNMRQIELATQAGISLSSLRVCEQGAHASNRTKRNIAHVFGITLAELGGPNVAQWIETKIPEKQKIFNEQSEEFFKVLYEKADENEREFIMSDDDNVHGFQEILWLARKYEIEIPDLHVRK